MLSSLKQAQPQDLGSVLTFLQICQPLDNEDFFKRLLLRPLKDGSASGIELLRVSLENFMNVVPCRITPPQALMSHICIRRTKEVGSLAPAFLFS